MSEHIPAGATELRFVRRDIDIPVPGSRGDLGQIREVKLLQSRHFTKLGTYHMGTWSEWADIPLVEPEDEDQE